MIDSRRSNWETYWAKRNGGYRPGLGFDNDIESEHQDKNSSDWQEYHRHHKDPKNFLVRKDSRIFYKTYH